MRWRIGWLVGVAMVTATAWLAPSSIAGTSCTITGTPEADRLVGTSAGESICGLGGDDRIRGRGGNDVI
jgi:hypothetical protein